MSNILLLNQPFVFVGLGTMTFTIPADGLYNVTYQTAETPPSSLAVVVKNNGATKFTAPALGSTQSAMQFKFGFTASAADVITVVMSSAAAVDNLLNSVKSIISIGQGL